MLDLARRSNNTSSDPRAQHDAHASKVRRGARTLVQRRIAAATASAMHGAVSRSTAPARRAGSVQSMLRSSAAHAGDVLRGSAVGAPRWIFCAMPAKEKAWNAGRSEVSSQKQQPSDLHQSGTCCIFHMRGLAPQSLRLCGAGAGARSIFCAMAAWPCKSTVRC
jgi:hypothetical protein